MDDQTSMPIIHDDLISRLPDDIISTILSYLFVDEAARTSVLSKRWRKLWLLSPINISDESIFNNSRTCSNPKGYYGSGYFPWIMSTFSHILSTHPGPIRSCFFDLPFWLKNIHTVVGFLRILTQKGIRNLRIFCHNLELPSFVLECETLVEVMLIHVGLPIQPTSCATVFPKVRKLSVVLADIDRGPLLDLLASTPITDMQIMGSYGITRSVVVKSCTLRKLDICDESQAMEEVIIEDAPNLVCLDVCSYSCCSKIMILNAPKLKELSCVDMNRMMFQVGSYQFSCSDKGIKISGRETCLPSLQALAIEVNVNWQAKAIPYLLKCFPCVQTLIIKLVNFEFSACYPTSLSNKEENEGTNDDDGGIVLHDDGTNVHRTQLNFNHHMKHVKLENYKGRQKYLEFACLIVSKAEALEKITLVCTRRSSFQEGKSPDEKEWMETHRRALLQNTASNKLQIAFLKDNSY